MSWLDRLLGRPAPEDDDRAGDKAALEQLSVAFDNVHDRTERMADDYRELERLRAAQRRRQP